MHQLLSVLPAEVTAVNAAALAIADRHRKAGEYSGDQADLEGRFARGLLAEAAVSRWLGLPPREWPAGEPREFDFPDLLPLNCGCKAAKWGSAVLIPANPLVGQILCWSGYVNDDPGQLGAYVLVLGYASMALLREYGRRDLVLCRDVPAYKLGFAAWDRLEPVACRCGLDDLLAGKSDPFVF